MSDELKELREDLTDLCHIILRLRLEQKGKCPFCGRDELDYHPEEECFETRTINRILNRGRNL